MPENTEKKPSIVLLLTSNFPFRTGEEFIENEITYLSKGFTKVLIAPLSYRPGMSQTRVVPENVELVLPGARYRTASDLRDIISFILRHPGRFFLSIRRSIFSKEKLRFRHIDLMFDLHCSMLAENINGALSKNYNDPELSIIYCYWFHTQARVAVALKSLIQFQSTPIISRGHRSDIYEEAHLNGHLPQRRIMITDMKKLYAVSEDGTAYLKEKFPRFAKQIETRYLGVNAATNAGNPSLQSKQLVTCSAISNVKRLPLLIEALAILQKSHPDVVWIHYGWGEGSAVDSVVALAREKLTPGSFDFKGAIPNSDLRAVYGSTPATAFINVSSSEGVPVSMMEALAQGLPLIATDVGGSRELINTKLGMFPGLLSSDPSPTEVASAIQALLESSDSDYANYVKASLLAWESKWSAERNYSKFTQDIAGLAGPISD
ncbi:glycosyltransferase [Leucobacter denitrificans]|uniref:Glycosyltransferase n=1 Tax=Leucobacter denitrificans TaxID=683042 RepID=A0A7G9S3K7_9MICO|nr:glycosyltransferase [Leucobacter denitrificans]QNN62432.1 glycosyltransferase [Leucobacter denitrificans]